MRERQGGRIKRKEEMKIKRNKRQKRETKIQHGRVKTGTEKGKREKKCLIHKKKRKNSKKLNKS